MFDLGALEMINDPQFGTTDNTALEGIVDSERFLRVEPTATSQAPNIIGGHPSNTVTTTRAVGATISGGGESGGKNSVAGTYPTIGGGLDNTADVSYTTVSGGQSNVASGVHATVAGGVNNKAPLLDTTVGGGAGNEATFDYATVAGGLQNIASGQGAAIPGGQENEAAGLYSFAAGLRAEVTHDNTFVWSSPPRTTAPGISSTGPDQFIVDAAVGVGIGTNAPDTQLDVDGAVSIGDLGVSAEQTSDIAVGDSPTDVVYDGVVADDRSEYDPATGVFTCANAGDYHVQAQVFWDGTLSEGDGIFLKIRLDGTAVMSARTVWPTSTTSGQRITQDVSKTLRDVSSGAEIKITAQHGDDGATHDIVGLGNRANLQISQIG